MAEGQRTWGRNQISKLLKGKQQDTHHSTISVKQWTTKQTTSKQKENLQRTDPRNGGSACTIQYMVLVVPLKNTVWISASLSRGKASKLTQKN
jgi:hypothetical protein